MKVNMAQELCTIKGEPLKFNDKGSNPEEKETATVGMVCKVALLNDDSSSGFDKYESWKLASRIEANTEVELTTEEITKVKKLVHKFFIPAFIGPTFEALEGRTSDKKVVEKEVTSEKSE